MKFASVLAFVAAATVVNAATNAERMARGLPPMAPARRASPVERAKKSSPSNTPGCSTGSIQCCQSHEDSGKGGVLDELLNLFKIEVPSGTHCGMSCSPITIIGGSSSSCTQEPLCCENNDYNGIVNVGCSPINIG